MIVVRGGHYDARLCPEIFCTPQKLLWGLFGLLLGGALEKVIPIASPCYKKSESNNYDVARCEYLVKNFVAEKKLVS